MSEKAAAGSLLAPECMRLQQQSCNVYCWGCVRQCSREGGAVLLADSPAFHILSAAGDGVVCISRECPAKLEPRLSPATRELFPSGTRHDMDGYPWTIRKVEIRCPCGIRFESAETYLQHKGFCKSHQEMTIRTKPPAAARKGTFPLVEASISRESLEFSCRSPLVARHQTPGFSARKQHTKKNLTLSHSGLKQRWHSDLDAMDPAAEHRIPSATSTNNIHCPCGRTFEKRRALDMHLRDSKIHRAEKMHSANGSMCLMPNAVQLTTPNAPAPASPPPSASTSMLDMSLLEARLLHCTCGQHFETQRILELHKRDSLYHQHHADDA